MRNRSTAEEVERRITVAFQLLMQGWKESRIVDHLHSTADWNVTRRQIRNYITEAQKMHAAEVRNVDRRVLLNSAHNELLYLYERAKEDQDWKEARACLLAIVELWNVNVADALTVDWRDEMKSTGRNPEAVRDKIIDFLEAADEA